MLWDRYAPTVHATLSNMVSPAEADDLMQDVAVVALDSIQSLRQPASFAGWLCVIARNTARDALRRRSQQVRVEIDEIEHPTTAGTASSLTDADEILHQIRRLPECYRKPLVLRLILQMSGAEIASQTGLTPGSVRVNLHRGMQLLRRRLQL